MRGFETAGYGRGAGEVVGRYLAERGHRRILCLFPDSVENARERFAGIEESVRAMRTDARIHWVSYEPPGRTPLGTDEYETAFTAFMDRVRARGVDSEGAAQIADATEELQMAIREQVVRAQVGAAVRRASEQTPASLNPTAVVAWNDVAAIEYAKVCRSRGRAIPGDVSLVSFDDTVESSLADITSYNFGESHIYAAMLDWVLWPDRRSGVRVVAPPRGTISERRSVCRV
jgi:DNA-binding LacI/PurR family transcriptional regulator